MTKQQLSELADGLDTIRTDFEYSMSVTALVWLSEAANILRNLRDGADAREKLEEIDIDTLIGFYENALQVRERLVSRYVDGWPPQDRLQIQTGLDEQIAFIRQTLEALDILKKMRTT